jgi:hydroxymethylpyrimidine/phosphomethylpyrimidine kinase
LKGGHLSGDTVVDVLATEASTRLFKGPRVKARGTHGTGCTLASAVATGIAQGMTLEDAIGRARAYVEAALRAAPGYGKGQGPLDHTVTVKPLPGWPSPQ